jgi:PEP-CTERM motif
MFRWRQTLIAFSTGSLSPARNPLLETETLMKSRIAWLATLCVVLAVVPALAGTDNNCQAPGCGGWTYDNGPINGTTDAWTINFGYIVSDTFVAAGSVNVFSFGVWEFPGDTMSSVQWSITSGENGGTLYGSGTASGSNLSDRFLSTNQYGYDIDLITARGLNVSLSSGAKYWLNLQNAAVPSGDPVYWDENSGGGYFPGCVRCFVRTCKGTGCPSQASESAIGTIPSESFTIASGFDSSGPSGTPEPSSILLFGSGVLGLIGLLRRKLSL